jgi:hypothetical protein
MEKKTIGHVLYKYTVPTEKRNFGLNHRREVQGTFAKKWLAAVPCPALRSCG